MRFILQGAVSVCRGWSALLWPKSSSSQVVLWKQWCVAIDTGCSSCCGEFCASRSFSLSVCLLSGKRVGGQTALEMGLVNRAVEQTEAGDAAYREALGLAREILPQVRAQTRRPSSSAAAQILMHPSSGPRTCPSSLPLLCFLVCLFSLFLSLLSWCFLPTFTLLFLLSSLLFRPLSLYISFTPVQMPAVGRARVAVKWRSGPQIAAHPHTHTHGQTHTNRSLH